MVAADADVAEDDLGVVVPADGNFAVFGHGDCVDGDFGLAGLLVELPVLEYGVGGLDFLELVQLEFLALVPELVLQRLLAQLAAVRLLVRVKHAVRRPVFLDAVQHPVL